MIQQRFEIERPVTAVYDAMARPQFILEDIPGVRAVRPITADTYRVIADQGGATHELELQLTAKMPPSHIEWRFANGSWSGAVDLEAVGTERTAVSVTADRAASAEASAVPASTAHEILQALKRALQPAYARTGAGGDYDPSSSDATGARRYASEWRETAQSAFTRPTEFPFKVIHTLSRQVDRLWSDVLRGAPMQRLPQLVPGFPRNPNVEVSEHEDEVRVCIDVPGVDESNLQVEIHEGSLTVRGERHDERSGERARRRSEVNYGSFVRRIPLPPGVDEDGARAVLRNGVLDVRIPLRRREPHRVPVQHAG